MMGFVKKTIAFDSPTGKVFADVVVAEHTGAIVSVDNIRKVK